MHKPHKEFLSPQDIQAIHDTSMRLLTDIGIRFPEDQALTIFKKSGFRVDGQTVYFQEDQVMKAIEMVPTAFSIQARNPDRTIIIGDNADPIFAPGYGAPFLIDAESGKRFPTLEDYHNLAKLAHMLPNQDMSGHLMVQPQDIPSQTAHIQMLSACISHSDKPFIGSTAGTLGARHTMEMLEILFEGKPEMPVTIGLINPLSPLGYGTDMIEAIIEYAKAGQPLIIATLVMAGSTGPITLAGVLAQQNAEILAGIVLAELIQPGLPLLYGSSSTNMDMRTGDLAIGSPEHALCLSALAQLARYYRLPCRGGGALTDSAITDAQAGFESMLCLLTALNSGVDFVMHAAGILGGFIAFSYEKFVMDDEICGMVRKFNQGIEVNEDTLAYDVIAHVGHDGHFLDEDHTLERCRTEFWQPSIITRNSLNIWNTNGKTDITNRARLRWQGLITQHEDPPIDNVISRQLDRFVNEKLSTSHSY